MEQHRTAQLPLADRFAAQRAWFATRASAIFPVVVRPDGDTILAFLDYWRLKNGLEGVIAGIRVRDEDGGIVLQHAAPISKAHNEISLGALLGRDHFDGSVEFEVVGGPNLVFNYAAVVAFYRSGRRFSVVHAPGRIRNADEPRRMRRSVETNWTCRVAEGVTPFFHVFNGPREGALGELRVQVRRADGAVKASRRSTLGLEAPFASRVVRLDEIFAPEDLPERDEFVTVELPDEDCFPRLVVGNFHRDGDFLEATHSFYWSEVDDRLVPGRDAPELLSFIPASNVPELDLDLVFYPTNSPGEVTATLREACHGGRLEKTSHSHTWRTGGPGASVWRRQLEASTALLSFDLTEGDVPSRINTSYRYSVRGSQAPLATDIATGAHAYVYPPKHSHWGHGLVSDAFETVLLIRNIAHRRRDSAATLAQLRVFDAQGLDRTVTMRVEPESPAFMRLRDVAGGGRDERIVSWLLRADHPDLEAFWITFSPEGSICGEHAF